MKNKSYIRVQRDLKVVDGKETWNRLEISKNQKWCCSGLKESPELYLHEDERFGFAHYDYNCGDSFFRYTEEIHYCPYCGKKIELVKLKNKIKIGTTFVEKYEDGYKQKFVAWNDGTISKQGCRYAEFRMVRD